ncbi:MAG: 3-phosphoserine/phosphohydroxythreonine transaminase [Candidatus Fimenecus sp.]
MKRVFNFSAGPSMLPLEVLQKAQTEFLSFEDSGQSVLEMSHRSKLFEGIIRDAEEKMRQLLYLPDNYKVLFLQGGASTQFSAIALNFMNGSNKADYVLTGQWSTKAFEEGSRFGNVAVAASSKDKNFTYIPKLEKSMFRKDADYIHITYNNTIYGTAYKQIPDTAGIPLIADVSSCFLSEPIDISKFGMIYGGAQKNIAPAGLTICIIREDLLGKAREGTPSMLNYKLHADKGSIYNTPPVYPIYICKLVLDWLLSIGGLSEIQKRNIKKAELLYNCLDESRLFRGTVEKEYRSLMNVTFLSSSAELDKKFIEEAAQEGLVNLKGYRTIGGMRASIYNAMPYEGVVKLVDFIKKFEKENLK